GSSNLQSDIGSCRTERRAPVLAVRDGTLREGAQMNRPSHLGRSTSGQFAAWSGGFINFGERDDGKLDLDYTMIGVSGGIDARFSDRFVGGIGFGYGRDRTDVGTNGGKNRADAYSGALYGSYQPADQLVGDALRRGRLLSIDSPPAVTARGGVPAGAR